jgi:hypothetical protein
MPGAGGEEEIMLLIVGTHLALRFGREVKWNSALINVKNNLTYIS